MRICRAALITGVVFGALLAPGQFVAAQAPGPPTTSSQGMTIPSRPADPRERLRRAIALMEGVLARAVEYGARDLNRRLRSAVPEMMALAGAPQARGVYLEGYGIYFDVSVPVLNQVMMWSWGRMLGPDESTSQTMTRLKSFMQTEKDPARRAELESFLGQLEVQLGSAGQDTVLTREPASQRSRAATPVGGSAGASDKTAVTTMSMPAPEPSVGGLRRQFTDLNAINRAYTESVQHEIVEAVLAQGSALTLKADEYLTIAARDNLQRDTLAPFDAFEEVVTLLLRFKGADLIAFRAGKIDEEELRRRIEVTEF